MSLEGRRNIFGGCSSTVSMASVIVIWKDAKMVEKVCKELMGMIVDIERTSTYEGERSS